MSWFFISFVVLLLLVAMTYVFAKRKSLSPEFKAILPHLLVLLLLMFAVSVLNHNVVIDLFPSSDSYSTYVEPLTYLLGLLMLAVSLVPMVKITTFLIFDFLLGKRQNINYPRLIKDIVVFILYIIGVLLIVHYYLDIKVTVVLASSAVLTVVIGFALQDILGDLFSGIVLNFEESLNIGDWIKTGDYEGRIEQFRWRSIKIRTRDNVLVLIPNQTASKKEVQSFGHPGEQFALRLGIGVSYKNSPDSVVDTLLGVMKEVPYISRPPEPNVLVKSFDDFSILYELRFWINDYSLKDTVKSEIRRKTWYAFKRRGIEIPFPIRDVYLKRAKEEPLLSMTEEEIVQTLQKNDILNTISEKQLFNLAKDVEIKRYGKGEMLITENEPGRYFYHILEGEAEVLKNGRVISGLTVDDYVGEMSLFTGEKTVANVRVTGESKILRLSSDKFRETVKLNDKMARKLSEVIAQRKAQLTELTKKEEHSMQSSIKKDSENIFLRIKKYFSV